MKLGELRGLIRKTKGNPYVNIFPFPGTDRGFRLAVQKTQLLEELERVYPGGKAVETGLEFVEKTGLLRSVEYDKNADLSGDEKSALFEGSTVGTIAPSDDIDLLDDSPAAATDEDDDLLV